MPEGNNKPIPKVLSLVFELSEIMDTNQKGKLKESKKRIIVTESQYKKILKETERLDEVGKLIAEFINDNFPTFESQYYSSFDEIIYDVYIEYHTNKVSVWNEKDID